MKLVIQNQYEQYEGDSWEAVLKDLKGKYDQLIRMTNFTKTDLSDQKIASYEVSGMILAKNGRAFSFYYREIVKKCSIKTALEFVDKKVAKQYETMPFSLQTAARRV